MKRIFILTIILFSLGARAQVNQTVIDSLTTALNEAKDDSVRIRLLGRLARMSVATSLEKADSFGRLQMELAEVSRNRKFMFKALMDNAERWGYLSMQKESAEKSIKLYEQALALAKSNKMEKQTAEAYLGLAGAYRSSGQTDKAMELTTEALTMVSSMKNDELKVRCFNSMGDIYIVKDRKLLALKNYLNGLALAEDLKNKELIRTSYDKLSDFYSSIDAFDKALDYKFKVLNEMQINSMGSAYDRVNVINSIAGLYARKKNTDLAIHFYEEGIRISDSLHFDPLKIQSYAGIINLYITSNEGSKALDYFNKNTGLKTYLNNFGFAPFVDQMYGSIYLSMNRYDSALIYLKRAAPYFEQQANKYYSVMYYLEAGKLYRKMGRPQEAITILQKASGLTDSLGNLELMKRVAADLDSSYQTMGDLKQASIYNAKFYRLKDSLEVLGREKDILQTEIESEGQRQDKQRQEKEIENNRRHNIQYMAITIGIATVFILLVAMGVFRVSPPTIRVLGFFAFIFLFEFIILIADHKIHHWTHGEPWKILAIKIILIAILLPLHHFLEEKVIHYLTSHKLLIARPGKGWWRRIFRQREHSVNKP